MGTVLGTDPTLTAPGDWDGLVGGVALLEVNETDHGSMEAIVVITSVLVLTEEAVGKDLLAADAVVDSDKESSDEVEAAHTGGQTGLENFCG